MDIIAGLLGLSANWMLGNKNRIAFILFNLANLFWIWVALEHKIYGLLIVVIPAILINIRNWIKWSKLK